MKKSFVYAAITALFVMALLFTSCQKEHDMVTPTNDDEAIVANSATAKLIERTSSNDGSFDNIVDGASCLEIRFPYTVSINGLEITINSIQDLEIIEFIFDEIEDDEDILDIIFPITVTMGDYTEVTINGPEELRELAEDCIEGGDDDDIECIDFVYPITLFTFDINAQQTGSVTVNSDMEMRRFFAGLDENDLISIDYPVTMVLSDGTEVQANSNSELASIIEMAKDACDEDDDNDHNDDDFTQEQLDELLVECPWLIREVQRDAINQTDQYFEYLMTFTEDGAVNVKDRQGNSLTGTWSTRVANHKVLLKLEFNVLVDFNLEWFVYELNEGVIKLFSEGGNKIIMESVCDLVETDPETLRGILMECSWIIQKVKNQGGEIDRLLGYEFNFMAQGIVTLSSEANTITGTWEISTNAQGRLVMAMEFGEEPALNFEWPLRDLADDRLKFEIEEINYELVLQRVCNENNDDGDVTEIRNILMGGEWVVAQYSEDGGSSTSTYASYTFNFQSNNVLAVTPSPTGPTFESLWRVLRNSDNQLKVYLNIMGEADPSLNLTDDWDFVSITNDRLELRDVSGGDGSVSILVFERIQ